MNQFNPENLDSWFNQLSTAVLVVDAKTTVRWVNVAAESLLSLSRLKLLNESLEELLADGREVIELMDVALQNQTSLTKRKINLKLADRATLCDLTVSAYEQWIVLEIHPQDRFLRIKNEENLHFSQASSKFLIRALAHEIKNPLAGIQGAAQLLERELSDDRLCSFTQVIVAETKRLSQLVDQLLMPHQASKFNQGNIHQVLERVYQLLGAEISQNKTMDVCLVRDYDPSIPEWMIDQDQLIQALLNIGRNALEAMNHSNNKKIKLKTRVIRKFTIANTIYDLVCKIEIEDNGPGVPKALQNRLFLPMVSSRANGSGLGLSITQSIVDQHKGVVDFESEPGQTCFSIYLPVLIGEENNRDQSR